MKGNYETCSKVGRRGEKRYGTKERKGGGRQSLRRNKRKSKEQTKEERMGKMGKKV